MLCLRQKDFWRERSEGEILGKSKYRAKYAKEIVAYFVGYASLSEEKKRHRGVPQFSKFARKIGVTLRTLENWRLSFDKFNEACLECEAIQREMLVDGGLEEEYNPRFAIFLIEQRDKKGGAESVPRFEDL